MNRSRAHIPLFFFFVTLTQCVMIIIIRKRCSLFIVTIASEERESLFGRVERDDNAEPITQTPAPFSALFGVDATSSSSYDTRRSIRDDDDIAVQGVTETSTDCLGETSDETSDEKIGKFAKRLQCLARKRFRRAPVVHCRRCAKISSLFNHHFGCHDRPTKSILSNFLNFFVFSDGLFWN